MITSIFKGDSTNIDNIKVKGETDYTLYSCRAIIVKEIGDTPIVDETFEPNVTDGFDVYFTPQNTDLLTADIYIIIYEITKTEDSVITYRREYQKKVRVNADGITNE